MLTFDTVKRIVNINKRLFEFINVVKTILNEINYFFKLIKKFNYTNEAKIIYLIT